MQRIQPPANFAPDLAAAWEAFSRHMASMPPRPAPSLQMPDEWQDWSLAKQTAEAALGSELVAAAYPGAPLMEGVDFQSIGALAADPSYLDQGEGIMETLLWETGARSAVAYLRESLDPETGDIWLY